MEKIQILFITFSNTVEQIKAVLKTYTDFPITVRANNWELAEDIEKIISQDRPRAIIYDGDFLVDTQLHSQHVNVLTPLSVFDVHCEVYSFEKLLKLPGVKLLTTEKLKTFVLEPT